MLASGRNNYYDKQTHQWYDTVMAIYEYLTHDGPVSAYYQTITTNSGQGYFEMFMGHEGTLLVSERASRCRVYRETWVESTKWDPWTRKGYLGEAVEPEKKPVAQATSLDSRESVPPPCYQLPVQTDTSADSPAALGEFLRCDPRQGQADVPARGRLRDRRGGPEGQRGRRGRPAIGVQTRRVRGMTLHPTRMYTAS